MKTTNCPNCGAVLKNGKCEYCGTEYKNDDSVRENLINELLLKKEMIQAEIEQRQHLLKLTSMLNSCHKP